MKKCKIIWMFCVLILPNLLLGQNKTEIKHEIKHEIKFNPFELLRGNIVPSYEVVINKKIGLELESGFSFESKFLSDSAYIGNFEGDYFDQTFFKVALSIKYYIFPQKNGFGPYMGPHFRFKLRTHLDDQYFIKWNQTRNTPIDFRDEKNFIILNYGINLGYKFLFKSHFTLDILTNLTYHKGIVPDDFPDFGPELEAFFSLKTGYRF